jgi:hypothetical protein
VLVLVSAQNCPPASTMCLSMAKRTVTTSPLPALERDLEMAQNLEK